MKIYCLVKWLSLYIIKPCVMLWIIVSGLPPCIRAIGDAGVKIIKLFD